MPPWKPIAAAAVIFVAGVVSGAMGMQLYRSRAAQPPPPRMSGGGPPSPWFSQRMDFMRRMGDRLGLSEQQRERINEILRESQQRSRELWEPLAPKFKEEMERTKKLIDAELTAEQREKAEIIHRERPGGPPGDRGPGSGRWREGDGQRGDGQRFRGRGPDRGPDEVGPPPPGSERPPSSPPPDRPPDGPPPAPPEGAGPPGAGPQ